MAGNEAAPDRDLDRDPGPEAGTGSSEAAAEVEADLALLAAERDELRVTAQRIQADFENYRKRVMREQTALTERATEGLVEALLPALDGLELAVANLGDTDEKVRKGVELAVSGLFDVLERNGVVRVAERGVQFDPNHHEAVMQDDGDGEPHVGDVLRTGYTLKGRVLRPAMVKVVRNGTGEGE